MTFEDFSNLINELKHISNENEEEHNKLTMEDVGSIVRENIKKTLEDEDKIKTLIEDAKTYMFILGDEERAFVELSKLFHKQIKKLEMYSFIMEDLGSL